MINCVGIWSGSLLGGTACFVRFVDGIGAENTQMVTKMLAVVDDDNAVGLATRELLRSLGYAAAVFGSAEEFLRSDVLPRTSCLITDVRMPGMSGVELQAHLIRAGFRFPIIFMTSFPEESTKARVLAAGAHSYVKKPLEVQAFMDCIEAAVQPAQKFAARS